MQTLTTLNELPKNHAGGVRFVMMSGPTRVNCWVTREALDRARATILRRRIRYLALSGTASKLSS